MKTKLLSPILAAALALLSLFMTAPGALAQDAGLQRAAAEALATELGIAFEDGQPIDFSNIEINDAFFAALENAARNNPGLAEALAVLFVNGLGLDAANPPYSPGDDELTALLQRALAAIINGAGLTGDAALSVANVMIQALPPAYQVNPVVIALNDIVTTPDLLDPINLRTISYFNYTAPPGTGLDFTAEQRGQEIIEEIDGRPTPTPERPRPTPTPPDVDPVTPGKNR